MKILVCGSTFERASRMLDNLYDDSEIKEKNKSDNSIILHDDTYVQAIEVIDNILGQRCDKLFIDSSLSSIIVKEILHPFLALSVLPENEQIVYWDERS